VVRMQQARVQLLDSQHGESEHRVETHLAESEDGAWRPRLGPWVADSPRLAERGVWRHLFSLADSDIALAQQTYMVSADVVG
jgi:hypothetical protein